MSRCEGKTQKGTQCNKVAITGEKFCSWHQNITEGTKKRNKKSIKKEMSPASVLYRVLQAIIREEIRSAFNKV